MARNIEIAAGLDVGSNWIRLVAVTVEDGFVHYRAHAAALSRGWHRGQISDQNALADCIRAVFQECSRRAGSPLTSAVVGVGGPNVRCHQGRGVYDFGPRRAIQKEDLEQAVKLAMQSPVGGGQMLLQALPQDFTVDGGPPVPHPIGVECERLEAHVLLVTVPRQEHEALVSAVQQAQVQVEETVFEAIAAAYAAILPEERACGVALADIGAHSTGIVFYDGDSTLFAAGHGISGDHFTRDISTVHGVAWEEAERLKLAYGCVHTGPGGDNIIIQLPADSSRPGREISRRALIETLEARAGQLFSIIERCRAGFARAVHLGEGLVLCGGGALMEGMVEEAERILHCPARLGIARGILEWPEELYSPAWTTAAGLAMYSARLQERRERRSGPGWLGLLWGK
ncbi:MAG: cell division protein FtsA [Bryobacteraceae bacterium]|nr:cell division protein FtsA [Bryobacteraceae bacterium]MCX7603589.1 cell division protein FtsA [Bryobacteraceae bacterium]